MDILDFLSKDNYIVYNKTLAKTIGINQTIIFMYFVSQYKRFLENEQLTEDGYFYKTGDDIYENTGLSRFQQKQAIDDLRSRGLLDYKLKGAPAKLYFKLFKDQLLSLFSSSFQETGKLVFKKVKNKISRNLKTYNNKINNKNNNISISKDIDNKAIALDTKKRDDIDFLINRLKKICNVHGVGYDRSKDRMFGKHICDSKEFGDFAKKVGQDRITFAENILLASIKINYWKGPCAGPKLIYQNYIDVYNQTRLQNKKELEKQQKNTITEF